MKRSATTPRPAAGSLVGLIDLGPLTATTKELASLQDQVHGARLPRLGEDVLSEIADLRERCDRRDPSELRVAVLDLDDLVVVSFEGVLDAADEPFLRDRLRPLNRRDDTQVAFDCSLLDAMTPGGSALLSQTLSDLHHGPRTVSVRQPSHDVMRMLRDHALDFVDIEIDADAW